MNNLHFGIAAVFCLLLVSRSSSFPLRSEITIEAQRRSLEAALAGAAEEHVVAEGHTVELRCSAGGVTPPMIHWLKDGEFIPQGPLDNVARNTMAPYLPDVAANSDANFDTVSTMLIKSASSQDTARYTCVADLPEERTTKHFDVVVTPAESHQSQPSKRSETGSGGKTRIYLYTDKAFAFEGPSSLFICRATQGPTKAPPTIQWSINGEPITDETPGVKLRSNGDLMVTHTTATFHMADLKCTATGEDGSIDEVMPFIYLFAP